MLPYCAPTDIRRKLDLPSGTIDADERERYATRAAAASQQWDTTTGSPMRTVRVGATGAPETYEHHDATGVSRSPPVRVSLEHGSIVPIDADAGDVIEVRTGRDSWDDVTAEQGDSWTLDNRRGQLKLYRILINRVRFEPTHERFVRLSYRHGGLGGDRESGATASLASDVSESATTLAVDQAARLVEPPFLAAVGDTPSFEYVRVTDVDRDADELTVTRGERSTTTASHDAGATVQYTPQDVREAVAARAAELLTLDDDARTSVPDDGQLTSRSQRADRFRTEWEEACAKHSSVMTL